MLQKISKWTLGITSIFAIALLGFVFYVYVQSVTTYSLSTIAEKSSISAKLSKLWIKACMWDEDDFYPNSLFGGVVAIRTELSDKFDFVIDTFDSCSYDINAKSSLGSTALHDAIIYNDLVSVSKLLSLRADVNQSLSSSMADKLGQLNAIQLAQLQEQKVERQNPQILKIIESQKLF